MEEAPHASLAHIMGQPLDMCVLRMQDFVLKVLPELDQVLDEEQMAARMCVSQSLHLKVIDLHISSTGCWQEQCCCER